MSMTILIASKSNVRNSYKLIAASQIRNPVFQLVIIGGNPPMPRVPDLQCKITDLLFEQFCYILKERHHATSVLPH